MKIEEMLSHLRNTNLNGLNFMPQSASDAIAAKLRAAEEFNKRVQFMLSCDWTRDFPNLAQDLACYSEDYERALAALDEVVG